MDPSQITSLVLGILGTAVAVGQWMSQSARRRRKRDTATITRQDQTIEAMTAWGEQAQQFIFDSRSSRRLHNADHHPDGINAVEIPEIPELIQRGIRAAIIQEADDADQ